MIIYSAMPMELIFANMEQVEKQEIQEIQQGGMTMLVEPTGAYEGRIVRLISPNPQDYLNPSYAPGQKIFFRPSMS
ncbi:YlzJ-like family protein [Brevibacillus dissolubilis]|uniref:YlzJ-like family protein n=1 Tax=Brevibacillus dissolubilis TaxID=1844116 RepID=UPI00111709A2|nr:YlzJ-like family protein [Brevibacillus dissolubilis]